MTLADIMRMLYSPTTNPDIIRFRESIGEKSPDRRLDLLMEHRADLLRANSRSATPA